MSINVTKEELFNMILQLQERLDRIEGKQRGPITFREGLRDLRAGNKHTMNKYMEQICAKGGSGKTAVQP